MGDRIVVLDKGHVQQIDTPLALYDHPANRFVAGFIGSPGMNFIEGHVVAAASARFEARGGSLSLPLSDAQATRLAAQTGREITLGVRPEDVYVADGPRPSAASAEATLQLETIEPMGNEIFLHTKGGDHEITARVAPQPLPAVVQPIVLAFDIGKLHFFDPASQAVVAEG